MVPEGVEPLKPKLGGDKMGGQAEPTAEKGGVWGEISGKDVATVFKRTGSKRGHNGN